MGVSLTLVATRAAAERTAGRALRLQPHHSTQTVFLGHRRFACGTCSWSAAEDRGIDPVLAASSIGKSHCWPAKPPGAPDGASGVFDVAIR